MTKPYLNFIMLLIYMLTFLGCNSQVKPNDKIKRKTSYYTVQNSGTSIIVFVHGFLGNSLDTWKNEDTNISWQTLIENDEQFNKFSIYNVNYPTEFIGNSLNINELGTYLQDTLESDNVFKYRNIHIISHSLGGLVTKDMLFKLNRNTQLSHIKSIAFLGVPSRGSSLVKIANLFPQSVLSKTLKDLTPIENNSYLDSLNDRWKLFVNNNDHIRLNSWYETQPTYGIKVVSKSEADASYDTISPLNKNHISISKPRNREDEIYKKVMHKIHEENYYSNKVSKLFHMSTIDVLDTNNTNQKYIRKKQHIELINYSNENIFIDRVELSAGMCFSINDIDSPMNIWIRELGDITKTLKIDDKIIISPNVKFKLEPNEHLHMDLVFTRKVVLSKEQLKKLESTTVPKFFSQKIIKNGKLMTLIRDRLMPYTLNINSTTDYTDCISLGSI